MTIEEESPAEKAGLMEGDVVIGFSDQPIAGIDDLHRLLTEKEAHVASQLTFLRGTEKKTIYVVPEVRTRED